MIEKEFINKLSYCTTYKFSSVVVFIELIIATVFLGYIYSIENPAVRPMGTLMFALGITFLIGLVNIILALILFGEYKLRKNLKEIQRHKLTHIGFTCYFILTLISILWVLINLYFMFRHN